MKKNKIFIILIGLLIFTGLVLAGCKERCTYGDCKVVSKSGTGTYPTCNESSCSAFIENFLKTPENRNPDVKCDCLVGH